MRHVAVVPRGAAFARALRAVSGFESAAARSCACALAVRSGDAAARGIAAIGALDRGAMSSGDAAIRVAVSESTVADGLCVHIGCKQAEGCGCRYDCQLRKGFHLSTLLVFFSASMSRLSGLTRAFGRGL